METLIVHSLLWKFGFELDKEYNEILHKMFLENLESAFLLELEGCSSNCDVTYENIYRFWNYEYNQFEVERFGKELFSGLETVYTNDSLAIKEFGEKCYDLWNSFPERIKKIEPFFTLCYADDCLSYGDEKQTRALYERAFSFYKEK